MTWASNPASVNVAARAVAREIWVVEEVVAVVAVVVFARHRKMMRGREITSIGGEVLQNEEHVQHDNDNNDVGVLISGG